MSTSVATAGGQIDQDAAWGLFSLPIEIRNYIYHLILMAIGWSHLPDRRRFLGCTKILVLCKKTYMEAKPFLNAFIPSYTLGKNLHKPLIRHPKANGKPNLYESGTRTSNCYKHQRCSQLELMRSTNLQLLSFEPGFYGHSEAVMTKMAKDLLEVINIIRVSSSTTKLFLVLDTWQAHQTLAYKKLLAAMLDLLHVCAEKEILLFIKHCQGSQSQASQAPSHPMIFYLQGVAVALDLDLHESMLSRGDSWNVQNHYRGHQQVWYLPRYLGVIPQQRSQNTQVGQDLMYNDPNYFMPDPSDYKDYLAIPECRTCLTPFGSDEDLREHLNQHSEHAVDFRQKLWNYPDRRLGPSGGRVCWTCGFGCVALDTLDRHLDEKKHRRHGIVPRYREDNNRWDKYWKAHKKLHGRL